MIQTKKYESDKLQWKASVENQKKCIHTLKGNLYCYQSIVLSNAVLCGRKGREISREERWKAEENTAESDFYH